MLASAVTLLLNMRENLSQSQTERPVRSSASFLIYYFQCLTPYSPEIRYNIQIWAFKKVPQHNAAPKHCFVELHQLR